MYLKEEEEEEINILKLFYVFLSNVNFRNLWSLPNKIDN